MASVPSVPPVKLLARRTKLRMTKYGLVNSDIEASLVKLEQNTKMSFGYLETVVGGTLKAGWELLFKRVALGVTFGGILMAGPTVLVWQALGGLLRSIFDPLERYLIQPITRIVEIFVDLGARIMKSEQAIRRREDTDGKSLDMGDEIREAVKESIGVTPAIAHTFVIEIPKGIFDIAVNGVSLLVQFAKKQVFDMLAAPSTGPVDSFFKHLTARQLAELAVKLVRFGAKAVKWGLKGLNNILFGKEIGDYGILGKLLEAGYWIGDKIEMIKRDVPKTFAAALANSQFVLAKIKAEFALTFSDSWKAISTTWEAGWEEAKTGFNALKVAMKTGKPIGERIFEGINKAVFKARLESFIAQASSEAFLKKVYKRQVELATDAIRKLAKISLAAGLNKLLMRAYALRFAVTNHLMGFAEKYVSKEAALKAAKTAGKAVGNAAKKQIKKTIRERVGQGIEDRVLVGINIAIDLGIEGVDIKDIFFADGDGGRAAWEAPDIADVSIDAAIIGIDTAFTAVSVAEAIVASASGVPVAGTVAGAIADIPVLAIGFAAALIGAASTFVVKYWKYWSSNIYVDWVGNSFIPHPRVSWSTKRTMYEHMMKDATDPNGDMYKAAKDLHAKMTDRAFIRAQVAQLIPGAKDIPDSCLNFEDKGFNVIAEKNRNFDFTDGQFKKGDSFWL